MNGSNILNHSMAATIKVVSGSTSVPKELKYRYGISDIVPLDPAMETCDKCHENEICDEIPVSKDWYMLCQDCEKIIRNLVKKEVNK